MITVPVALEERSYDVIVGSGALAEAGRMIPATAEASKAFVVSDRVVADLYLEPLTASLAEAGLTPIYLSVPDGEDAKTLDVAGALYRQLAVQEAHRDDLIVALGGGAVGDLAGFVAATYMRGIAVAQVPTTLTAQVDAAIGGKTALNLPEGKNLVGLYHQPSMVIADVATLTTLSEEDYRSGLGEVAKYALTLDAELLATLEADVQPILAREPAFMEGLVGGCAAAKVRAVVADERDAGERLILNYGHTLGHALERLESFRGRSHGEGVAMGMVFAARLSEALGFGSDGLTARHVRLLSSLGLETTGALPAADDVLAAMQLDKKYRDGIRFVLLEDVERPKVVEDVPEDLVRSTLIEMGAAG